MEHLIEIKKQLVECVEQEISQGLCCVNTHELGEVIDMIKDLDEAIFYCIMGHHQLEKDAAETEALALQHCCHCEGTEVLTNEPTFMKKEHMAATYDSNSHDSKEGCSYKKRKAYLDAKEHSSDKIVQMKELEEYLKDLSTDVTEMIKDASVEERQLLEKRIQSLATKISQL